MARPIPITKTGIIDLGATGETWVGTLIVEVIPTGTATFSLTFRGRVFLSPDSAVVAALDGTAPQLAYTPLTTGALTDGTTAVTAAGIYAVRADACKVGADVTAFSKGTGGVTLVVHAQLG